MSPSVPSNYVQPTYKTEQPNAPIALGRRPIILHTSEGKFVEDALFVMPLLPYPRVVAEVQTSAFLLPAMITTVETPGLSTRVSPHLTSVTIDGSGTQLALYPNPDRTEVFSASNPRVRTVVFHLMNFFNFSGGRHNFTIQSDKSLLLYNCVILMADGWRVTVHSLPETPSLVDSLKFEGGYAITHVGKLERVKGGQFTIARAKKMLNLLRLFFSFARGSFVSCDLAVGYNEREKSWEQWGAHIAYSWTTTLGWFSGRPACILEDVFPGFYSLLQDELWEQPTQEILYWYLRANNTSNVGVDGGLVLSQAALEKLAKIYLVDQLKFVSARNFRYDKQWNTTNKIAELLLQLKIPLYIPSVARVLRRMGRKHGWADGPRAVVEVRNGLVHADRYVGQMEKPYFEAWQLAQWYVELVILRLARHMGQYTDRISAGMVGETAKVPWA